MSAKTFDYYTRRAEQETEAAERAASERTADIHRTLATMYRTLVERRDPDQPTAS